MRAVHANEAVRLGLRAASRNPELAFGKALLNLITTALSLLPMAMAALLLWGAVSRGDLEAALAGLLAVRWPAAGAALTVAVLSLTAGAAFAAGAVPLLAADAELGQRPPLGAFGRLVATGFARVFGASLLSLLLSLLFSVGVTLAIATGAWLMLRRPGPLVSLGLAFALALSIGGGILLEQIGRLMIVRASALGERPFAALFAAARLVAERLSAVVAIALAFWLLELVIGATAATLGGSISGTAALDAGAQLVAIAPRLALYIATAAVVAWLEIGRQGALAALVAGDAGLLEMPDEPPARASVPTSLERPTPPEPIIEALPVEPIIEALAVEPVIEALPVEQVIEALPVEPIVETRPVAPVVEARPAESVVNALPVKPPADDEGGGGRS